MNGYRDLIARQKAVDLVAEIYRVTRRFPKDELYGLVAQLRRAAVSIPSNLAEGYGRNSTKEFHHFIGNARGSLLEVETQIEIAKSSGFLSLEASTTLLKKTDEVGRIMAGLRSWSAHVS